MSHLAHAAQPLYTGLAIAFGLWLVIEVPLSLRMRARGEAAKRDKNTLSAIWATLVVANTVAIVIAWIGFRPITDDSSAIVAGIAIFSVGVMLRLSSIATLGRMFTYNVAIRDGHVLKTSGLYRFIRHPAYSGLFFAFVGIGLALNDWLAFLIGVIPVFLVLAKRIDVEEKVLMEEFGSDYARYKARTYRLIPGLY